jgi:hypothetical protein
VQITTQGKTRKRKKLLSFRTERHFFSALNVIILLSLFIVDYECDLSKNVKSTISNVLERHINTGTRSIVR